MILIALFYYYYFLFIYESEKASIRDKIINYYYSNGYEIQSSFYSVSN